MCTVPSERYNHGSVYFKDGTFYVYGGYSQRCADYCDDVWMFDIYIKSWREVHPAGTLSQLDPFVPKGEIWGGPGKRWRMSMVNRYDDQFVVFGGHRLWQGFAEANSQSNDWSDYTVYPRGGYLDDFWIYTKILDTVTVSGSDYKTAVGEDPVAYSSNFSHSRLSSHLCYASSQDHGSKYSPRSNVSWILGCLGKSGKNRKDSP